MSATLAVVPGRVPYGAAELKSVYQRNFFLACCIAAVLHLAIIGSYAGWLRMHPELVGGFVPPGPGGGTQVDIHDWFPPPPIVPHMPGRGVMHRGVIPATPVPVADSLFTQDTAVTEAPGPGEEPGGPEGPGGEGGIGNGTGLTPGPEEPPPEFRPLEREPVLIKAVLPHYPETARLAGIEGVVLVKLWVDSDGRVRQATVVRSTWEIFDEPALEAARQSVFRPAYMTGGAVSVWVTLPFRFRISNAH